MPLSVAKRNGLTSIKVISWTPIALRQRAAPRPIAPPPRTTQLSFSTGSSCKRRPRRAACQLQAKGSVNAADCKSSARGTTNRFSLGIATISAKAPGRGGMEMIWRPKHIFGLPDRQAWQVPQPFSGFMVTNVPSRGPPTIVPEASWPRIMGVGLRVSWPRKACISDPQMPEYWMRTNSSPALAIGSAWSIYVRVSTSVFTKAFILPYILHLQIEPAPSHNRMRWNKKTS